MNSISNAYQAQIDAGAVNEDPVQRFAVKRLDDLAHQLVSTKPKFWGFSRRSSSPRGLYIWGGVGRGKSMLMDLFVAHLSIKEKRRVHFHEFMQDVHNGMNAARKQGKSDALAPVADALIDELRVLALDEMQISDIADAMIVGRLFARLFEGGVTVVTTSNRPPSDLYKDGLNRKLFEPFIDLIQEHLEIHELDGNYDYRQSRLADAQAYFTPANESARQLINQLWSDITAGNETTFDLTVKGRTLTLPRFHNGAARVPFNDLCGKPLGASDYLALAEAVRVLILEDVPQLSQSNFDAAKRFVTLVDALYEARVKLIVSAASEPESLYQAGRGSFEFERTASRLREMQSADWPG